MEGRYWNRTGEFQAQYDEMLAAEKAGTFKFTQAHNQLAHSYYRYYNDGDLPGWARTRWNLTRTVFECDWTRRKLNQAGEEEFERRVTQRLEIEWRRYIKAHNPAR